ncbi:MAG: ABC transporter permease [Chitinophagaceae bacterium]|nr:ABC transporter permease [Chitinophagaceae bacterium]
MIKNYFKIAWRHLQRNKSYTFINVAGLTLGITCSILIFIIVRFQLSFDDFHKDTGSIYRVVTDLHHDNISYTSGTPAPLGKALRDEYTFSEKLARVRTFGNTLVSINSGKEVHKFVEKEGLAFAEPEFFDLFNFPLVKGDKSALTAPNNAFITEKLAHKYFPGKDAIGQTIRIENSLNCTIAGVLKDLPAATDRVEQIYLPFIQMKDLDPSHADPGNWTSINNNMQTFVRLKKGISPASVEKLFPALMNKYYVDNRARTIYHFRLQPLGDIHFNPNYSGLVEKEYIWALALVGLFLIITACVNFVNLATAQALTRSKEIGVRKVLGGRRFQLFWQFIAETALITLLATVIAFFLAKEALPYVNQLLEMRMTISFSADTWLAAFLLILAVLVTFLAGSYPGLVLAGFQPVLALKGKLNQQHIGGFSLRRALVIVQFSISQLLIISTIVIAGQIHYSRKTDLGFIKDGVVLLPLPIQDKQKMDHLRTTLASMTGVEKTSLCFSPPASGDNDLDAITFDNRAKPEPFNINEKRGDDQYLSTFGLTLIAGRNFFPSDSAHEYLINETLVRKLNLSSPQEAIGKSISVEEGKPKGTIVGVVKDFYNYSFKGEIAPICINSNYRTYSLCAVKLNMARAGQLLPAFEKLWNNTYPEYNYTYQFMDDSIAEFYEVETVLLALIEVFAGIAIFIGCLGLYGMVSFMAVQKTKEIGVRKVLGAGVQDILWIFGKEFLRLLILAFLVAAPVGGWFMHNWLQDFVYRIPLNAQVFLLALLSTIVIATLTIGYRTLRSALANPVKSLRTE